MRVKKNKRQCHVCGVIFNDSEYGYWGMEIIRSCYALTDNAYMCGSCSRKADSFLNYYGIKKHQDVDKLKSFLRSGFQIKKDFSSFMNAGYF